MCLAIPGKLIHIQQDEHLPMGKVDFSGVKKSVCLAFTPEAQIGDYVVVHVGFSISILNEKQALEMLKVLSGDQHEICG